MGFYKGFLAEDFCKNKGFWTLNDFKKTLIEEVECKSIQKYGWTVRNNDLFDNSRSRVWYKILL